MPRRPDAAGIETAPPEQPGGAPAAVPGEPANDPLAARRPTLPQGDPGPYEVGVSDDDAPALMATLEASFREEVERSLAGDPTKAGGVGPLQEHAQALRDMAAGQVAPEAFVATPPPNLASLVSESIANRLLRFVLGAVRDRFLAQVIPTLRAAIDNLDKDSIKRALNAWVESLGGAAPFPEVPPAPERG